MKESSLDEEELNESAESMVPAGRSMERLLMQCNPVERIQEVGLEMEDSFRELRRMNRSPIIEEDNKSEEEESLDEFEEQIMKIQ